MTDAFEEVNEAIAKEDASRWWKRAAPLIYGAGAVLILGVAGFEAWRWNTNTQTEAAARDYAAAMEAVEKNDLQAAKAQFEKIAGGEGGFAALANNVLAAVDTTAAGDPAVAEARLTEAARIEGPIGDIATLKLAYLKADKAGFPDVEAMVKPLIDKGGPLGALGRELVAAKAFASGDIERARRDYQALTLELDAPPGMQERVGRAVAIIPPAPAPESAAPTPAAGPAAAGATP